MYDLQSEIEQCRIKLCSGNFHFTCKKIDNDEAKAIIQTAETTFIIGNPRVLQTDAKNWLPLLRYCRDNKSWQGQEWDEAAAAAEEDGNDIEEVLSGKGKDDEEDADGHGWHVVTDHEAQGFINREE